jgi:outer membrane biosynthesis protein TonB
MPDSLFVNADWSALVPAGSAEAAFGITPKDAKRRGLLPLETGETLGEPETLMVSANLLPEPEPEEGAEPEPTPEPEAEPVAEPEPKVKQAPKPANKAARKPANKAARKPANK